MLFILLVRSDVTTRPWVIYCYTAKGRVGVGDNFTRLAILNKQDGQSVNQQLSGQIVARAAKEVPSATVDPEDEG